MEYILLLSIPKEYMEKPYYIFIRTRDIDKFILSPEKVKPVTKDWIRKVMKMAVILQIYLCLLARIFATHMLFMH